MKIDANPTAVTVNKGPFKEGVDGGVPIVVPVNPGRGLDLARVAFTGGERDPEFDAYLKFIGADKEDLQQHPQWKSYFKLMKDLQLDPYGFGFDSESKYDKMTAADRSEMNSRLMMISQLGLHLGGFSDGDPIPGDVEGDHNWLMLPGAYLYAVAENIVGGGINYENAAYMFPNFQQQVQWIYDQEPKVFDELKSRGIIYMTSSGDYGFELFNYADAEDEDNPLSMEARDVVDQALGAGPAKYLFVASINALRHAMDTGAVINETNRPIAYTWNIIEQLAREIDLLKDSRDSGKGNVSEDIAELRELSEQYIYALKRGLRIPDNLIEKIEYLAEKVGTVKVINKGLQKLLSSPVIGLPIKDNAIVPPEAIEAGYTTLQNFEKDYNKLFNAIGLRPPPGGVHNFSAGMKMLLEQYNTLMYENEHLEEDGRKAPAAFSTASVDLLVRSQQGFKLSKVEQSRLRGLYQYMDGRDGKPSIRDIESAIAVLIAKANDPGVKSWENAAAAFNSQLTRLDQKLKAQLNAAAANYFRTVHTASYDDTITQKYINILKRQSISNEEFTQTDRAYLPRLLTTVGKHANAYPPPNWRTVESAAMTLSIAAVNAVAPEYAEYDNKTLREYGDDHGTSWVFNSFEKLSVTGLYNPNIRPSIPGWVDPSRYPERQFSSLLTNTQIAGSLLHLIAMNSNENDLKSLYMHWKESFSFRPRFVDSDELELRIRAESVNTAAEILVECVNAMDKAAFTGPFKFLINRAGRTDADYYRDARFYWTTLSNNKTVILKLGVNDGNFERFARFYKAQKLSGYQYAHLIEVGATGLQADVAQMIKKAKKLNKAQGESIHFDLSSAISKAFPDVSEEDQETVRARLADVRRGGDEWMVTATNYFAEFPEAFPHVEEMTGAGRPSRAACYWLDHPWSVIYASTGIAKTIPDTDKRTADFAKNMIATLKVAACPDDPTVGKLNKNQKWFQLLRPEGSAAPLTVLFTAMQTDNDDGHRYLNRYIGQTHGVYNPTTHSLVGKPSRTASVSMEVAKNVLTSAEFGSRIANIQKHAIRMKTAAIDALRTAAMMGIGEAHIKSKGTLASFVNERRVQENQQFKEGNPVKMHSNVTGDPWVDNLAVVTNPYARRFGTLLEMKTDMIRVMLNPALSCPVVKR